MSYTPIRGHESPQVDFQALDLAFLGSLLPGIIHNWATPLSGVIGATQLLERRVSVIHDLLSHYETLSAAEREELQHQLDRNQTNVDILSRNAQHLADLLQVLVQRITRSNGAARDCFPLNELVQNELRFLEANLQFKHKVKKTVALEPAIPATPFCYGFVASALDELVTSTIGSHDFSKTPAEMSFETLASEKLSRILVSARYAPITTEEGYSNPLPNCLNRLTEDGWQVDYNNVPGASNLMLSRPQRMNA
jgi:signal transduction histidine kinase